MDNNSLWSLTQEAGRAIVTHYAPVFDQFAARSGLSDRIVGLLLAAITFEPETVTPARLRVRDPYTAAEAYLSKLASAAQKGYLAEQAPGEFRLPPASRAEVQHLIDEARAVMARADPLTLSDSQRLASLLDRLVLAGLNTPPPPDTWSIRLSYKLMPAAAPPLPYTEQAISCLHGYRDDAHLAAWQPSGLTATALETLTLLWRGEADSLEAVCEKSARRGHPSHVYAEALAELRKRSFLEGPESAPRLTEAGKTFRDRVEDDTDHLFFAPWTCLNDNEAAQLAGLLTRLRDGLRKNGPELVAGE
jgi:helix-turn-helix protein